MSYDCPPRAHVSHVEALHTASGGTSGKSRLDTTKRTSVSAGKSGLKARDFSTRDVCIDEAGGKSTERDLWRL